MIYVLSVTSPIFIIVLVGYFATRSNIVSKSDIQALGSFVIRFALPALIFRSLSQRSFVEIINLDYLTVYIIGSLSTFVLIFASARFRGRSTTASAIFAMGSSVSNSGFIGYPVAVLVLGPPAVVALAMTMMVENILMIPLGLVVAEVGCNHGKKNIYRVFHGVTFRLAKNPLIIAILAGTAMSLSGLALPSALFRAVDMFAMASGAVALFFVGGTLVGLRVTGMMVDVGRIVGGKLFLHPTMIFLALFLVPSIDPTLKKAMLIFSSVPVVTIFSLLGRPYGQQDVCAAALMVATIISFVTISCLLLVL
ncbi:AEC family transporter [Telmatospirillum sp.]|uniref:AEC family transporter n=1 Tax=Telmatospirillum sp. TaxID=2079197 RepID=UPI00284FD50B|nr:AEC family transporter [Telmatospirillum sp.]MDR3440470.1 AEC family transporter [Telmatospirillum sp.]